MTARVRQVLLGVAVISVLATPAWAQKISVTGADPSSGGQGSVDLVVRVTGSGFQPGAKVHFYKSKTTDPGGITVKQSAYVSATEVLATIDIAGDAALSTFDIEVVNTNSRSGKGGDLFLVTLNANAAGCTLEPLDPSRFVLEARLNDAVSPLYGPKFGVSSLLGKASLTNLPGGASRDVLVAAVGTTAQAGLVEVFVLDAISGARIENQPLCSDCAPQPHRTVPLALSVDGAPTGSGRAFAAGEVNGDGIPDFLYGDYSNSAASLLVSRQNDNGTLDWGAIQVPRPSGLANFGWGVALGDIDHDGDDDLAIGQPGGGTGKQAFPAAVYIYRFDRMLNSIVWVETVTQASITPAVKSTDNFARSVALGDVVGDSRADLIVGAPNRTVNGIGGAGAVFVLEALANGTFSRNARLLLPAVVAKNGALGYKVAVGNADNDMSGRADVVATTSRSSVTGGEVFPSPVQDGQTGVLRFTPRAGYEDGWSTAAPSVGDVNGDGLVDISVGAPNAGQSGNCNSPGMAYLFLGAAGGGWTRTTLQAPEPDSDFAGYGMSTALADGYPFLLVGEQQRNPNGQDYVYRVVP